MESDGPYTEVHGWHGGGCDSGCGMGTIEGPGFDKLPQKVFRELDLAMLLNVAHAEGRKSMDKDFKELLEFATRMYEMLNTIWLSFVPSYKAGILLKFYAWKKARGIE